MMSRLILGCIVIGGLTGPLRAAPELEGDYRGALALTSSEHDLLTRLVIVTRRDGGNDLELQGYLSFHLGDFTSGEYVTYSFDQVRYNLLTGEIVFEQTDQGVIVQATRTRSGELQLAVQSPWLGEIGHVTLRRDGAVTPERSLMPALAGTYQGECEGEQQTLILQTLRLGGWEDSADGFGAYQVMGRMGAPDRVLCPDAHSVPCAKNMIDSGRYNFFAGTVELNGRQGPLDCRLTGTGLECGSCRLRATSRPDRQLANLAPAQAAPMWGTIDRDLQPQGSLAGAYAGYLHLEGRDLYLPLELQLTTYRDQQNGGDQLQIAAIARLKFDADSPRETKALRFERQGFNLQAGQYLFAHPEGQHDARPLLMVMNGKEMAGVWYSTIAGRVGTFKLVRIGGEPLPAPGVDKRHPAMTQNYHSQALTMRLAVNRDGENNTGVDPFSPLSFSGYFWYNSGIAPRITIEASSYDFYTGKIGFVLDEGRRMVTGWHDREGQVALQWQTKPYGGQMQINTIHTLKGSR